MPNSRSIEAGTSTILLLQNIATFSQLFPVQFLKTIKTRRDSDRRTQGKELLAGAIIEASCFGHCATIS
jgi:hypothetical protein